MTIFPRSLVWDVILGDSKNPNFIDHISKIVMRKDKKCGPEVHQDFFSYGF